MSTPAYITIDELKLRADVRGIARLATDETEIADKAAADTLIATGTATALLTALINDASIEVRQDVRTAFDPDDPDFADEVKTLTYNIVMYKLYARRFADDMNPYYSSYQTTMSRLKDFRRGQYAVASDPLVPGTGLAYVSGTSRITDDDVENF